MLIGQGLAFPFTFSGDTMAPALSSDHARVQQSIRQIFSTEPGQRFMRPDFGVKKKDLVFEQNGIVLRTILYRRIVDAIAKWETRITLIDIRFEKSVDDPNHLIVTTVYQMKKDGSQGAASLTFQSQL